MGKRTSVQAEFLKNGYLITLNVGMMLPHIHNAYWRLKVPVRMDPESQSSNLDKRTSVKDPNRLLS